jgi:hypothetical protein
MPASPSHMEALFEALDECFGGPAPWRSLVEWEVAVAEAPRFKVDVSFALGGARKARFSINDKGEPVAFRERVSRAVDALGLSPVLLERMFALSPAGQVQTTLGVKWDPGVALPERVSVYFEELAGSPHGERIRRELPQLAGVTAPALAPRARPNAVCLDFSRGEAVASKVYDVFVERPNDPRPELPPPLERLRDTLPFHAVMRTRRTMLAARFARGGELVGHKLFWMTELQDRKLVPAAWSELDRLRAEQNVAADPAVDAALARLRRRFSETDVFLFPDLIGLNVDAAGNTESLVVHVSLR